MVFQGQDLCVLKEGVCKKKRSLGGVPLRLCLFMFVVMFNDLV
jgi:hypothetical protein